MKQGDLVYRKSYGGDVLFKIQEIRSVHAVLRGVDFRLLADSPVADLETASAESQIPYHISNHPETDQAMKRLRNNIAGFEPSPPPEPKKKVGVFFELPGKVLHLDGDPGYLRKCMHLYEELRVPAEGYYVPEAHMDEALYRLLPQVNPDIVVITGHDGILKHRRDDIGSLSSYKNSHNFVNAVKVARQYEKNRDALTIIAGACQSHFEALLQAGANFASSPARVLIHALDPLCVAAKVAYTSIKDTVNVADVINLTSSGVEGVGGIESKGSHRMGLPKVLYSAPQ
ncbi:sporulation peptidase YabG [Paenibacillus thalictri]|uniref:Sporulation peptidase YabG n=1 Tax=Paenibacillus thalictri TaxID=2527873 RepID=A0A4Q9DFP6_9BACL|nr:sporulation peptidase YabG [Paenibacillus thalictri]TBL69012.1 sporulation peptidase YabG [Paenibacillus thalictri]